MSDLGYRSLFNLRSIRWRYVIPIALALIVGLTATVFLTTRQIRIEANMVAVEKARGDLQLGEAFLDSRLPGPWSLQDGRLYKGETLINDNFAIVDEIGCLTGDTCTIFQGDTRVATNVVREDKRAVGTKVSDEVENVVLGEGQEYYGEAEVVGVKYQAAYKPIRDSGGHVIGIWYVGASKQFVDKIVRDTVKNVTFAFGSVLFAIIIIIWLVASTLTRPISKLVGAANRLAQGELDAAVTVKTHSEIGHLARTFEHMRIELRRHYGELQKTNKLLKDSEQRFRMMLENVRLVSVITDAYNNIIFCNNFLLEITGWNREEILGQNLFELFKSYVPINKRELIEMNARPAVQNGAVIFSVYEILTRDRKSRLILSHSITLHDHRRNTTGTAIIGEDITERIEAEEKLLSAHQQLLDIIEFLPDATFVIDSNRKVIAWNKAIEELTGVQKRDIIGKGSYAYAEAFCGEPKPVLIDLIFSDEKELKEQYPLVQKKGNTLYTEFFAHSAYNGVGANLWAMASPLFDRDNNIAGAVESIRDVTERKIMEKQLKYLATHDALTNIPNRHFLNENLMRVVAKARRGVISAFLFIDLDNFKHVNDTLGHAAGDELLIAVTNILKKNLREEDFLARFGGDEFCVLLEGTTIEEAGIVAEKLRGAVEQDEFYLASHKCCVNISISIGVSMIDGAFDSHKILSSADSALYIAKDGGRNRVSFIQPDEDTVAKLSKTNQLVTQIKNALREDNFMIYFQPVISMDGERIMHHEVLLRLRGQDGKIILPGQFIPVAERFGLMPQIDRWVVQSTLAALLQYPDLRPFINLSGTSLGDEALLEFIEKSIQESGADPSRIGFEITETAAVKDVTLAKKWIRRFKNLGCRFALDDFGIGFSSFSYLRFLPVDYLKIDGTYIRDMDKDFTHRALVKAMNAVAHALGKKTIAEFVENKEVMKSLQELQVDYGQGYYIGKPGPHPEGIE